MGAVKTRPHEQQAIGIRQHTLLAVEQKRSIHVASFLDDTPVSPILSATNQITGIIRANNRGTRLVEVVNLRVVSFIDFIQKPDTVNVVGFGVVGIVLDEQAGQFGVGIDGITGYRRHRPERCDDAAMVRA
jgi:hypothetical protein